MIWIWIVLAVLFVLDALRLRWRASGFCVLAAATPETDASVIEAPGYSVFAAPEVVLGESLRRRAVAYAAREALDVVDLCPADLDTSRALALLEMVDPRGYRQRRLALGRTAGHAVVVSDDVRERAELEEKDVADPVAFARLAGRLKRYAAVSSDYVVVPGLAASPERVRLRRATMKAAMGGASVMALIAQFVVLATLITGLCVSSLRLWALVAVGAFHAQTVLALAGTPFRSRDLVWAFLFRVPLDLVSWLRTVFGQDKRVDEEAEQIVEKRPAYRELLAKGEAARFEPRRTTCPVCAGPHLTIHLRTRDLLQHKPGRFHLERCGDCGHIFQNPRLSLAGLDFYYKDFYDGLGAEGMEFIFGYSEVSYVARARMVKKHLAPKRWLDVGAGHGHFCSIARDHLPDTRFDGLDLSESIEDAHRRKWVDKSYRGLFPDVAPTMKAAYDLVSMHHYLEHTLDPRAELVAAHTALATGGGLLIEVPDPESLFGKILRRYWIPWFQPQHQHLLSQKNLERLLGEAGFAVKAWERAEAHQPVDVAFAVLLALRNLAPPDAPWRPAPTWPSKVWQVVVWSVGTPFLALGFALDWLGGPLVRALGMSNTYRVLAVKEAERTPSPAPTSLAGSAPSPVGHRPAT